MRIEISFTPETIIAPPLDLPSREIGAVVEFLGIVREMENARPLRGLDYEAYEPMARSVLERHFIGLATSYPCAAVYFIHRTGHVPVGEASLWIRVLASHRTEAIAFLDQAIIRLKSDVPIWKRPPSTMDGVLDSP